MTRAFNVMFLLMLASCGRGDCAAAVTDALAVYRRTNGLKLEHCFNHRQLVPQLGHRQDQDAVALGRIGKSAVDRLEQDELTVVGTDGPLGENEITLVLARAPFLTANGHVGADNSHSNILRL